MPDVDELHSTKVSPIDRLPTEVLSHILSFVPPEPHLPRNKVVVRVRCISRRIRTLVDLLPFWYEEGFFFDQICPLPPSPSHEKVVQVATFTHDLLLDRHLRDCLAQRKRRWTISSPELFRVLADMIPGFRDTAEYLFLGYRNGFGDLTALLHGFTNLRELHTWSECPIDVATLPPSLRRLRIGHSLSSIHSPPLTTCSCTFESVENLVHFEFAQYMFGWLPGLRPILPIRSATTLQSLNLFLAPYADYAPLDMFPNVTNLGIMTSYSSFFRYMQHSVLRLSAFRINIKELDAFIGFSTALTSPSLRSVEHLRVGTDCDPLEPEPVLDALEPVLATIAEMPLLESVSFSTPVRKEWAGYLRRFRRLQSLRWRTGLPRDEVNLDEVGTAFETALGHLQPTPRVEVSLG
jgi:F-box domain